MPEDITEGVSSKDLDLVKDVLITITKTVKTFNVYPKDNPIYQRFATALSEKFNTYFETHDDLILDIDRNSLLYEENEVFHSEELTDNIALLLYADGIRQISFHKGMTFDEIVDFIDVLRLAPRESLHDDITTLLWDKNIKHLEYIVAEETVDEELAGEEAVSEDVEEVTTIYGASYSELTIKPVFLELKTEPLTDEELSSIKTEVIGLSEKSLLSSATNLFLAMLTVEKDMEEFSRLTEGIGKVMDMRLKDNDLKGVLEILQKLKKVAGVSSMPEQKEIIDNIISKAGNIENLRRLFGESLPAEDITSYLMLLKKSSLPNMIEILGELQDRKHRKLLCSILIELGKQDIGAFSAGITDKRWYLVRNIVMILGMIKEPAALKLIEKALKHPEPRVRREALRALECIGSEEIKKLLFLALKDEDSAVRTGALRAMRRIGGADLFHLLKGSVSREELKKKSFTEKKELLEALASLGGQEAFPLLLELFKKKGLIEKDDTTEIRACAAYALGIIRSPEAISLLQKETSAKKSLLRDACLRAIKEAKIGGAT
ncbi:MAG: HEAT repeat domain-containing protein [Nitrospirae bacterium]|nr:HEAT repeat domain-containing protein [Nitrospirota bacterium]